MNDIVSSLTANRRSQTTEAGNIGAAKALGGSGVATFTVDNATKQGASFVGGAKVVEMGTMWQTGEMMNTGNELDVATGSASTLLAMKTSSGSIAYTRTARLEVNAAGELYSPTHGGAMIMGRAIGTDGVIPNDMSNLDALETIVVPQQLSAAEATKNIAMRMNLAASQAKIRGEVQVAKLLTSGVNASTRLNQIIVAGGVGENSGSINVGDQLILKADDKTEYKFEFGGVTTSRQATTQNKVFGATNSGKTFDFNAAPNANQLNTNGLQGLQIDIGGARGRTVSLYAKSNGDGSGGAFNSIDSLAIAINKEAGLQARVDNDGRLHIAHDTDPDVAITFSDIAASGLKRALGINNIAANTAANTKRFATLDQLQRTIAAADGLDAAVGSGGVEFFADLATQGLTFKMQAATTHHSYVATQGGATVADNATVTVTHANHGLQTGDLIRVANGGTLANDIYRVVRVNADQFKLHTTAGNVTAVAGAGGGGGGALLGAVAANTEFVGGRAAAGEAVFSWNKVEGRQYPAATQNIAITNIADGANIVLTVGTAAIHGGGGAPAAGGINANDIVYISGIGGSVRTGGGGQEFDVPDGYYQVQVINAGAGTLSITPLGRAAAAAGYVPYAAGATVTKVSGAPVAAAGAGNVRDSLGFTLNNVAGTANRIKIYSPHASGLKKDQYVKFRDLPAATVDLDGGGSAILAQDVAYKIAEAGNDAEGEYIEIDLFALDADGKLDLAVPSNSNNNVSVGSNILGLNYRMDTYAKTAAELGLNAVKENYAATYVATDQLKSLAYRALKGDPSVHTQVTQVVDSLGQEHSVGITFAKLTDNQWAVEVHGMSDTRGIFDFNTGSRNLDGQIAYGTLRFDPNGQLMSATGGVASPLNIEWLGGAAPSQITIDWGAMGGFDKDGKPSKLGMTQVGKYTEVQSIESDGIAPSRPTKVTVGADGIITVHYANSRTMPVGILAAAHFKNVNGLAKAGDGMFIATMESGTPNIGNFGTDNSFGELNSKGLLGSNVEEMEAMLKIQELTQHLNALSGANAKTLRAEEKAMDRLTQ